MKVNFNEQFQIGTAESLCLPLWAPLFLWATSSLWAPIPACFSVTILHLYGVKCTTIWSPVTSVTVGGFEEVCAGSGSVNTVFYTVYQKTVPLYIRSSLWQILTDFRNFFTVVFSIKFATKSMSYLLSHFTGLRCLLLHYLAKHKRPKLAKCCCT